MWSELFCRASDNLLSLHFASANVLGHYSRRFKRFSLTLWVIEFYRHSSDSPHPLPIHEVNEWSHPSPLEKAYIRCSYGDGGNVQPHGRVVPACAPVRSGLFFRCPGRGRVCSRICDRLNGSFSRSFGRSHIGCCLGGRGDFL